MVFADLIMYSGWGLINPILAVFIVDKIKGGNVEVAGIAIGIYWVVKSIIQIPLAHYLDRNHGEKDDFYALVLGMVIISLIPLGFIFVSLPWHMYFLQIINAVGMALVIPSWAGIFTRHIERKREAFCWSIESSAVGVGSGIGGIVGGIAANSVGFIPLFIGVSVIGLISTALLLSVKQSVLPKERIYPIPKA